MRSACGTPSARHRKHHLDGVRVPCPVGQFCLVNWTGHCASWRLPRRGCGAHAADMRPLVYSPCRWRGYQSNHPGLVRGLLIAQAAPLIWAVLFLPDTPPIPAMCQVNWIEFGGG
ncbi:hypothetical protein DEIGR_330093 [Deinococcus grandis]|uniref:Uncharacterized protein n=1 Tax=Deinococcus grandis TaxID=57498 RepID=A0A124BSB6_9DEIO|nr:hypothetical protein DEGR_36140 [Deinococcus grandis]GAQ23835.1 hypothetical protein DEIGR_330093 [Deinococcus grandis]